MLISIKTPLSPAVLPPSLKLLRNKKCDSISQTELSAHPNIVKSEANFTKDQADKNGKRDQGYINIQNGTVYE